MRSIEVIVNQYVQLIEHEKSRRTMDIGQLISRKYPANLWNSVA